MRIEGRRKRSGWPSLKKLETNRPKRREKHHHGEHTDFNLQNTRYADLGFILRVLLSRLNRILHFFTTITSDGCVKENLQQKDAEENAAVFVKKRDFIVCQKIF